MPEYSTQVSALYAQLRLVGIEHHQESMEKVHQTTHRVSTATDTAEMAMKPKAYPCRRCVGCLDQEGASPLLSRGLQSKRIRGESVRAKNE